ncbi:MAG: ion transporter, partial [Ruminiclostridium sp.]|nr:ion transporter [Ruminiclostridium sp.]
MSKKRIFDIIQIGNKEDVPSRAFDIFISVVIILNILVMFLETFIELESVYNFFKVIEYITIIIFCIEYILRFWTSDILYPRKSRLRSAVRFLLSFDGIVDLLTILPFFFLDGFVIFRMLRIVRIFHLFRVNSQYDSFNLIKDVLKERRRQLFSSMFMIVTLMLASSLAMYGAEHDAQPDSFENAFSGIWWSVSTVLTVGYGDIYPITIVGKIIAIIISFLGVCAVAVPTGIISAGFVEMINRTEHDDKKFEDFHDIGEILCSPGNELIGMLP